MYNGECINRRFVLDGPYGRLFRKSPAMWCRCPHRHSPGVMIRPAGSAYIFIRNGQQAAHGELLRKSPPGNQSDALAREYSSLPTRFSSDMASDALMENWSEYRRRSGAGALTGTLPG